jgi:hypothetical protein
MCFWVVSIKILHNHGRPFNFHLKILAVFSINLKRLFYAVSINSSNSFGIFCLELGAASRRLPKFRVHCSIRMRSLHPERIAIWQKNAFMARENYVLCIRFTCSSSYLIVWWMSCFVKWKLFVPSFSVFLSNKMFFSSLFLWFIFLWKEKIVRWTFWKLEVWNKNCNG